MEGTEPSVSFHLGKFLQRGEMKQRGKRNEPQPGLLLKTHYRYMYRAMYQADLDDHIIVCGKLPPGRPKDDHSPYDIRTYSLKTPASNDIKAIIQCLRNNEKGTEDSSGVDNILRIHDVFEDPGLQLRWVVSEHASLTLRQLTDGIATYPQIACHDDIGSMMRGAVNGLKFLNSHQLQHNEIGADHILITPDGVVKIGGIHHISSFTPDGSSRIRQGLINLANDLIIDESPGCSHCVSPLEDDVKRCLKCNRKPDSLEYSLDNGFYCQGESMRKLVQKLEQELEQLCRERPGDDIDTKGQIREILDAVGEVPLIKDANGAWLSAIVSYATSKVYLGIRPTPAAVTRKKAHRRKLAAEHQPINLPQADARKNLKNTNPRALAMKYGKAVLKLIDKHGDNLQAMADDKDLNPMQLNERHLLNIIRRIHWSQKVGVKKVVS